MEFQDDGGTPAWRANQATWNHPLPWWQFRKRWNRLGFFQQITLILGCLAAPWVLLIFLLIFWGVCGC